MESWRGGHGWSPDGQSIAFWSTAQGNQSPDIYTYNAELETPTTQVTFEGENQRPVFSPDGARVAFASEREGTDGYDLWVKTLDDDSEARSIIRMPGDQFPTQWPSDTLIVFESGTNRSDLWMVDLSDPDNSRPQVYLESEVDLRDMVVSRDGTLAAYWSTGLGTSQVYIRGFPEAGAPTRVSEVRGQNPPFWSPDGDILYYWGYWGTSGDNFMAAHIQRDPTPVVLSQDTLFTAEYVALSSDLHPDGDRLVAPLRVGAATSRADDVSVRERFILVTNWFTELCERTGDC